MNKAIKYTLREAVEIAGEGVRVTIGSLALPVVLPVAVAGVAALSAVALGTWIAGGSGRAILSELRRRARLRAPRAPSPSLRGTPTAEEFAADAAERPRTLAVRLRIGSRLADLAPTLDCGNHYDVSPTGAKRICGRGRGMRGWLEDNRVGMAYSTLMRYMRLAVRLRVLLGLDERVSLEWLLPGAEVPVELRGQCAAAKRRLARLMREHWNFSRLQAHVDEALAENTRHELADFLRARDLPPKMEKLRREAVVGFLESRVGTPPVKSS